MTETSRCLDSHSKLFCTVGASIFGLQAQSIQQTFPWSRKFKDIFTKQEISKADQSLFAVSCRMSHRLFHESGTPMNYLTFRQVQQSSLCRFFVSSLCKSPGKSSFLPRWLTNFKRSLLDVHLPLEVDWCCQEQICLIVMKSLKFLNIWKAIFWRPVKDLKNPYPSEIFLCISRKSN